MTIHIKTNGGYMRGGKLYGQCEKYVADDVGNGTKYKGNFIKNKLSDPEGEIVVFTDDKIEIYKGSFTDGEMDGEIDETVIDLSVVLEDEKIAGNCSCGTRNRRIIKASEEGLSIGSTKKKATYSGGVRGSEEVQPPENKNIEASRKLYRGRFIFDSLEIT
jgi:hypothetical protein